MRKAIQILEIPIYLLVIAFYSYTTGNPIMAFILLSLSIIRLYINNITYKSRES